MSKRNRQNGTTAEAVIEKTTDAVQGTPDVEVKVFDINTFMKEAKTENKKKVVQLSWYLDTDKADYQLLSRLKAMNINRESLVENLLIKLIVDMTAPVDEKGEKSIGTEAV